MGVGGGVTPPAGNAFDLAALDFDPAAPIGSGYFKGLSGLWVFVPPGAFGEFWRSGGAGALPSWVPATGLGDMLIATYDPTGKAGDAFDFRNFAIPLEARGDFLIKGSGLDWERLPIGPVNFVLTSNGAGSDPSWKTPAGDMLVATFDPSGVGANAFDFANMQIAGQAAGDMLAFDGAWSRIVPDPNPGRTLVTQGAGNPPQWDTVPFARNGVDGLVLSRTGAGQITIAGGICRDDGNDFNITLAAPVVVDFANPVGANGLDIGAEAANTFYDVYLIDGPTAPSVAGLFVVQGAAPTLPALYTRKRLLGTRRNDSGSNLIDFYSQGEGRERTVIYLSVGTSRVVLSGGAATVPTFVDCSALVPPTTQLALLTFDNQSGTRTMAVFQDTAGAVLDTLQTGKSRSLLFALDSSQRMAYSVNVAAGADANVDVRGFVESI